MLDFQVLGTESHKIVGKAHIMYLVNVRQQQTDWEIQIKKRFSSFRDLHRDITKAYNASGIKNVEKLPPFPGTNTFGLKLSDEQINKRMQKLQNYLRELQRHVLVRAFSSYFQNFFQIPKKVFNIWADYYGGFKVKGQNNQLIDKPKKLSKSKASDIRASSNIDMIQSQKFSTIMKRNLTKTGFQDRYSKSFAHENFSQQSFEDGLQNDPAGIGRGRPTGQGMTSDYKNRTLINSYSASKIPGISHQQQNLTAANLKKFKEQDNSKTFKLKFQKRKEIADKKQQFPHDLKLKNTKRLSQNFSFGNRPSFESSVLTKATSKQPNPKIKNDYKSRTYEFSEQQDKQQQYYFNATNPKAGDIYEPQNISNVSLDDSPIISKKQRRNNNEVLKSQDSFGFNQVLNKTLPIEDTMKKIGQASFTRQSFLDDDDDDYNNYDSKIFNKKSKTSLKNRPSSFRIDDDDIDRLSNQSLDTSVILEDQIKEPPSLQSIHDSHLQARKTYFMLTKD